MGGARIAPTDRDGSTRPAAAAFPVRCVVTRRSVPARCAAGFPIARPALQMREGKQTSAGRDVDQLVVGDGERAVAAVGGDDRRAGERAARRPASIGSRLSIAPAAAAATSTSSKAAARAVGAHECGVGVPERCGQPPGAEGGVERPQPGEGEFGEDAALRPEQFVPLVAHHALQAGEPVAGVGLRQQQRQALRCGDEDRREPLLLPGAGGRRRVGGGGAHVPGQPEQAERDFE